MTDISVFSLHPAVLIFIGNIFLKHSLCVFFTWPQFTSDVLCWCVKQPALFTLVDLACSHPSLISVQVCF